jgi:hypothetical protein
MLSAAEKTMEIFLALHDAAFWLTTAHFTKIYLLRGILTDVRMSRKDVQPSVLDGMYENTFITIQNAASMLTCALATVILPELSQHFLLSTLKILIVIQI